MTSSETPPKKWSRDWLWGALLIIAVFLAYSPVWYAGYIWDDDTVLTENPVIVGPLGLKEIWTTEAADICPFTLTTFWLEHKLWGANPLPYHLVNVLLHALSAIVLWRLLLVLRITGAIFGAALWAVHPVQVESVAWVSELKNTESCLFYLLAIFFFARSLNHSPGRGTYALTLLFSALAIASKSSTVILPVVLCLCAWWIEGRWQWRNLAKVAPILLLSFAGAALSLWTQQLGDATNPHWSRSFPLRLAGAGDVVWFYLGKLAWPCPLLTIYPRWHIDIDSWISYLPLVAVIAVFIVLWRFRETWARPWFFAFAYFLIALLPVLGLVQNYIFRYSVVFDHLQYLAAMGPLALAGAGATRLAQITIPKIAVRNALAIGVLLLPGLLTWHQSWFYENKVALWMHTLDGNPQSADAYSNLGFIYCKNGQVDEAISCFEKAVSLDPESNEAEHNLGVLLTTEGKEDQAESHLRRAVEIYPHYAKAQYDLAAVLQQKGQSDEALEHYCKVLETNPDWADVYGNIGAIYSQQGKIDDAIAQYQTALEYSPDRPNIECNLGNALLNKGQVDDAITHLESAMHLAPEVPQIRYNLGNAYATKGSYNDAITQFQEALKLRPDYAKAQTALDKARELAQGKPAHK